MPPDLSPEVSKAASTVIDRMGLVAGPVLDELLAAAESAATVDDLPLWARNVLAVPERPAAPVDDGAPTDIPTDLADEQEGWVDVGQRMIPNTFTIRPPAA